MTRALILLYALALMPVASAADDDFLYCTTCHGADGNGNRAIRAPKIAGMEHWYVEAQLAAFRAGWRGTDPADAPGHEMRPVAAVLPNDATLARAVAYVAAFVPSAPPVTVTGDAAHGATLYAPCAACHGADGRGNEALAAPALAGQSDWYLVTQLHNYRDGRRGTNPEDVHGATMRPLVATLVDEAAIVDVVAYINSLH
jgi:cytochrome c553